MSYIDPNSNGHLHTPHAITQKPFDYSAMEAQTICSVCSKLVKTSEAVETYASEGHQNLRHKTPAHSHCAKSRAAEIAGFRGER